MRDVVTCALDSTVSRRSLSLECARTAAQADDKALEEHFAEVAPIRRAFHVTGKDRKPRGMGFVQYATKEDAEEAISTLNVSLLPWWCPYHTVC